MKIYTVLLLASISPLVLSCKSESKTCKDKELSAKTVALKPEINLQGIVNHADVTRKSIEAMLSQPVEVSTQNLREKIKQKWEKIHFYSQGGKVVRIKTYAYPSISSRSEEFYLENEQLILAVVKDRNEKGKSESKSELDKLYYYHDNKMVKELKNSTETEYTIKDSDGEELMQELKEYLEVYKSL